MSRKVNISLVFSWSYRTSGENHGSPASPLHDDETPSFRAIFSATGKQMTRSPRWDKLQLLFSRKLNTSVVN